MIALILILTLFILNIGFWIFLTTTISHGENHNTLFKIKSILYWLSVLVNFSIGLLLMTI